MTDQAGILYTLPMGCDLHCFVEYRQMGKWRVLYESNRESFYMPYKVFDGIRHYALFGVLAGVRDSSQVPISRPRGMPSDTTLGVQSYLERWGDGVHSHTYLYLSELLHHKWPWGLRWVKKHLKTIERLVKEEVDPLSALDRLTGDERVRLVMWFDS